MKSCLTGFMAVFFLIAVGTAEILQVPGGYSSIQEAIDAAQPGDTVLVAEGRYFENLVIRGKSIVVASTFIMDQDESHITNTIIDGSQAVDPDSASVILFDQCPDTTAMLCGFSITGGSGTVIQTEEAGTIWKSGGGIACWESNACIKNNYVYGNSLSSDETVNAGYYGGGIGIDDTDTIENLLIIRNNRIYENAINTSPAIGGGISLYNIDCLVENNQIMNNAAGDGNGDAYGGGLSFANEASKELSAVIRNNIIDGNQTYCIAEGEGFGGGVYFWYNDPEPVSVKTNPMPLFYNNQVTNNKAGSWGGGIAVWRNGDLANTDFVKQPVLINNTVVGNRAANGYGMFIRNAVPVMMNTIMHNGGENPQGEEIYGLDWIDGYYTLLGGLQVYNSNIRSDRFIDLANCVVNLDPNFVDSNYHLAANSPCVGMGRPSLIIDGYELTAPSADLEGNIRPGVANSCMDLGAYESAYEARAHPVAFAMEASYLNPLADMICLSSKVFNPDAHTVKVFAEVTDPEADRSKKVELFDDGNHDDGAANDGNYSGYYDFSNRREAEYVVSHLNVAYPGEEDACAFCIPQNNRFTTIGPIKIAKYYFIDTDETPSAGDIMKFKVVLRNEGQTTAAKNVSVRMKSLDPLAEVVFEQNPHVGDIPASQTGESEGFYRIKISDEIDQSIYEFQLKASIYAGDYLFWEDTTPMVVHLEHTESEIPIQFSLSQNYPNPFNPQTTIDFSLPQAEFVTLRVYDVLGREVATLVSENLKPGYYTCKWKDEGLASGVYIYKLVAGKFEETKKMVFTK